MRPPILVLLVCLQLIYLPLLSQTVSPYQVNLKTGRMLPPDTIQAQTLNQLNNLIRKEPATAIIQFQSTPATLQKNKLFTQGIRLQHYMGAYAYTVSIQKQLDAQQLKNAGVRSVMIITPEQKLHPSLPSTGTITVYASVFEYTPLTDAIAKLKALGFTSEKIADPVLKLTLPAYELSSLAALPFIEFIEPAPGPLKDLLDKSLAGTRGNVLQAGDYGLTGEGITLQITEIGGYPQGHLDFIDRSILGQTQPASNYHSTHVHGIAAGAGNIDERYKGYAPKARILSATPSVSSVPANVVAYGVDLTNNSYGSGQGCGPVTTVNSVNSLIIDKQAIDFPSLLNIYAAGNDGTVQCSMYPLGYNTIDVNLQTSKSVITVGATTVTGELSNFSSKGPVFGGRIKPEIAAPGENIFSTVPNNGYYTNNGTSMAAPAVMGALALLYQRYRPTHANAKPSNALMKALICNTATDMGPTGPDYGYGFGFMNLSRAIQCLDAQHFYNDSVAQSQTKTKTITVPAGTSQLKVMLYWMDRPASPLTTKIVINDLDISVVSPQGIRVLPYVLDTVPALVANPAHRGADHVNTIEQVVIDNPTAGNYNIEIKGYELGEGEQQPYYVVYDVVPQSIEITYPAKGQALVPGEPLKIQWDSWGTASAFSLEFSPDNGQSWQLVSNSIAAGSRWVDWTVPAITTNNALFRLTRSNDNKTSISGAFKILGVPVLQLSAVQCPGSIAMFWPAVAGATDYEVMRYQNAEMVPVAFTSQTSYFLQNLSEDSTYWVTVRARYNGQPGRRAVALSRQPNTGTCTSAATDGDIKMDALLSPLFGRQFTSQKLGVDHINVRIKNLDDAPIPGFTVSYSVNNSAWTTESVASPIAGNSTMTYAFTNTFDFSAVGTYNIGITVHNNADANNGNDTLRYVVKHVANNPISVTAGSFEDVEAAPVKDYAQSTQALDGLERFDYNKYSETEVLRVGSHYAQNVTKSLEMVYRGTGGAPGQHSLTATYNLSQFDTAQHAAGLDFSFVHNFPSNTFYDSLLVRGSDTAQWILMGNLYAGTQSNIREVVGMAIGDSLKAYRQNYSSSFQLKWSPSATTGTLLIDNIRLYNMNSDVALLSIDSLLPGNCGLTANTPIRITVQNRGASAVNNVAVKYKVDGGAAVTETIPAINARTSFQFTFNQKADLSSIGLHTVEITVEAPGDSYTQNNFKRIDIRNLPLVKTFPALEDLENSNGGWFTEGANSTWQWGTPSSPRINGAASGIHAWKTNLQGSHNPGEVSFLYTGCYDLSAMQKPVVSISAALNIDSCGSPAFCDLVTFQYSTDGINWRTVPNKPIYNWPLQIVATQYYRWHVMSERLPDTLKTVRFRFQFRSDGYNTFDGIGIDDFYVYDSTALIYEGASNQVQQNVSGNQWTEFRKDGKLLASIDARGQNLGNVSLQTFVQNGSTQRNFHGQYYAGRNFALRTSNSFNDSIRIRFYFTDKEPDSLLFARNCINCIKPSNAYRFGLNLYRSSSNAEMDSAISNNITGNWLFIPNSQLKTVPFANGYYVEVTAKDIGEFRLSNGGLDARSEIPVRIQQFTVQPNAQLQWQTAAEINIHHFDIEVAKGNDAFQQQHFEKIGEVPSRGRSATPQSYSFTDNTTTKTGVSYYRLKNADEFGNFTYTNALPLVFSSELNWQVYPNPSTGRFTLVYQSAAGNSLHAELSNAVGQVVKKMELKANGFVQRANILLTFPAGIYYLRITDANEVRLLRLVKE